MSGPKKCFQCGAPINIEQIICEKCGAQISEDLKDYPTSPESLYILGTNYQNQHNYVEAIKNFEKISKNERTYDCWIQMGNIYKRLKKDDAAIHSYNNALFFWCFCFLFSLQIIIFDNLIKIRFFGANYRFPNILINHYFIEYI